MTSASNLVDNILCGIVALSPNQWQTSGPISSQWNRSAEALMLIYEKKTAQRLLSAPAIKSLGASGLIALY